MPTKSTSTVTKLWNNLPNPDNFGTSKRPKIKRTSGKHLHSKSGHQPVVRVSFSPVNVSGVTPAQYRRNSKAARHALVVKK